MREYSEQMKKMLHKQYDAFADNVISKVSPQQNARVLEIGPGPGWGGISLLRKRPDLSLVGVEASPDMVEVATENARREGLESRARFLVEAGESMASIPDGQYDLVISRESLHHWADPKGVFKSISRVLKRDGRVCIYDHRRDLGLLGRLVVAVFGTLRAGKMAGHWKRSIAASYTSEEVRGMLDALGFDDWTVETDLMNLVVYRSYRASPKQVDISCCLPLTSTLSPKGRGNSSFSERQARYERISSGSPPVSDTREV